MDYASDEVLDRCLELASFGMAIDDMLHRLKAENVLPLATIKHIAIMNAMVYVEFSPKLISLFSANPRPRQDNAYEVLFSFREAMGPVVERIALELDKVEQVSNITQEFSNLFIF